MMGRSNPLREIAHDARRDAAEDKAIRSRGHEPRRGTTELDPREVHCQPFGSIRDFGWRELPGRLPAQVAKGVCRQARGWFSKRPMRVLSGWNLSSRAV